MSVSGDRPSEFLGHTSRRSDHFSSEWSDMPPGMADFLDKVCDAYDTRTRYGISDRELDAGDREFGWLVCLAHQRGWIDMDRDIREREWLPIPRYGLLVHRKVHGFPVPVPKTGDPTVAQPRRPRAINLED